MMAIGIRDARAEDLAVYLRLRRELGVDDPAPTAQAWRQSVAPTTQIAEERGRVAGFVSCQALSETGYLRQIVVDPAYRRSGVGRRLMCAAAERLRAEGVLRWQLNVKPDNAAAIALYTSLGMSMRYESAALRLAWDRVAPLSRSARVGVLPASRDEAVERLLGQPRGFLRSCRARSAEACVLYVERAAGVVGLAAFDPEFGGAFPFIASEPSIAAALLRSVLDRRVDNGRSYVQLVVEADPSLVAQLQHWGASIALRMCHYEGPLPSVAASDFAQG